MTSTGLNLPVILAFFAGVDDVGLWLRGLGRRRSAQPAAIEYLGTGGS